MQLAADAGLAHTDLLLLTDAADPPSAAAAAAARAQGVRVSVLGVGTAQGAPVPLPGGSFATDRDGRPLLAALQAEALAALAAAGGGRYQALAGDDGDLRRLGLLDPPALADAREDPDRQVARYHDDGPWLVLMLLPLVALGFRRGWLGALLPLALLLPPTPAQAFDWSQLWLNAEQRAQRALQAGDHAAAAALAAEPARRGSAAYRAGEFEAAIDAFAQAGDADGHYNRGNALARAGRLQDALDAYDQALALAPDMEDAHANRAIVEQALQQPPQESGKQQGQPQPNPQDQQASPQDGETPPDDDGESSEPSPEGAGEPPPASEDSESLDDQPGKDGDDSPGEPSPPPPTDSDQQQALGEAIDQAMQDATDTPPAAAAPLDPAEAEALQAAEQRLRRIPDDPGGLLRRKFALEHRRRLAEGKGGE
jgi:Ca-activated chloride channel homolog